ncbi:MAG: helix-turn-helix domain-containing protein [Ruminococcaceae bacterium]|nr:helix-turn-helix domain-containing protein [Oscillospiraceae bacterium]
MMTNSDDRQASRDKERTSAPSVYQKKLVLQAASRSDPSMFPVDVNKFLKIAVILTGHGMHRFLGQDIPCKSGDIYIIPPNTQNDFFCIEKSEPLTVRYLLFNVGDWFDGDVAVLGAPHYCYGVFHDNAAIAYAMLNAETLLQVTDLLDSIAWEIDNCRVEWQDAVRAYLTLLLITVGRYVSNTIQNIPKLHAKEWRTVMSALHTVNDHFFDSELTLRSVADALYISESHLSRLVKRLTGKSFSEYLKGLRLHHACKLLQESALTVEEIVRQCGLRDLPSFYAGFHAHTGMTPSQFRASHTKKQNECHPKGERIMIILSEISENLQKGKSKLVKEMVQQALDEGSNPEQILNEGLLAGMSIIGEKFKNNEVYVPEVLVAARAMNMGVQVLKPHLMAQGVKATGKVCIGTVQGDLHDIGKNLVKMMMEGKGLEVIDLGTDVPAETFVQTAIEQSCRVICCSALLTTTMGVMGDVVKAAEAAGIRDKVKIMVGGAPVTDEYCKKIGADCYTVDAASAADAAVELCR